jgi:hypothetical protein
MTWVSGAWWLACRCEWAWLLLWVGNDVQQNEGVAVDPEVEAPVLVDPTLPPIIAFIVLLGPQRRMT